MSATLGDGYCPQCGRVFPKGTKTCPTCVTIGARGYRGPALEVHERNLFGCLFEAKSAAAPLLQAPPGSVPDRVDLRQWMSPVEDQGQTSSCTANAIVGAMEYLQIKSGKTGPDLSRLFVYYNARRLADQQAYDSGSLIHHVMAAVLAYGACDEQLWPFDPSNIPMMPPKEAFKDAEQHEGVQFARAPLGLSAMQAVAMGLPVVFGCYIPQDYYEAAMQGGVMPEIQGQPQNPGGGHAMLIAGYDQAKKHWIVRNSWGAGYGDQGYLYIPFSNLELCAPPDQFWVIGALEAMQGFRLAGASPKDAAIQTKASAKEEFLAAQQRMAAARTAAGRNVALHPGKRMGEKTCWKCGAIYQDDSLTYCPACWAQMGPRPATSGMVAGAGALGAGKTCYKCGRIYIDEWKTTCEHCLEPLYARRPGAPLGPLGAWRCDACRVAYTSDMGGYCPTCGKSLSPDNTYGAPVSGGGAMGLRRCANCGLYLMDTLEPCPACGSTVYTYARTAPASAGQQGVVGMSAQSGGGRLGGWVCPNGHWVPNDSTYCPYCSVPRAPGSPPGGDLILVQCTNLGCYKISKMDHDYWVKHKPITCKDCGKGTLEWISYDGKPGRDIDIWFKCDECGKRNQMNVNYYERNKPVTCPSCQKGKLQPDDSAYNRSDTPQPLGRAVYQCPICNREVRATDANFPVKFCPSGDGGLMRYVGEDGSAGRMSAAARGYQGAPLPVSARRLDGCLFEKRPSNSPMLRTPMGGVPDKVDLRQYCSPVEDQGQSNSCTANATVGALEYLQRKSGGQMVDISRLFVYYNARKLSDTQGQDCGSFIHHAMASVLANGACEEAIWPFDLNQVLTQPPQAAYQNATNHEAVQYARTMLGQGSLAALAAGFPVVFGTYAPSRFYEEAGKTGLMPAPAEQLEPPAGGHAMLIVGYDLPSKTWLIRNSWGPNWGDQGYFRCPFATLEAYSSPDHFWAIGAIEGAQGLSLSGPKPVDAAVAVRATAAAEVQESLADLRRNLRSELQTELDKQKEDIRKRLRGDNN